jgi:hypothetical protein
MRVRFPWWVTFVVGCSSPSFAVAPPASTEDATIDISPEGDASTAETTPDVVDDGGTSPPDSVPLPDTLPDFGILDCDPTQAPPEDLGVFVSPTGSDATGDGTRTRPFLSIARGLDSARAMGRTRVFLDAGTYPEAVTVPVSGSGIFLEGGFRAVAGVWRRNCAPGARTETVIASPGPIGVLAEGVRSSGLRGLTVTTKPKGGSGPDRPGESLVGVFVRGDASFELDGVAIVTGDAGDGGPASPGSQGSPTSCDGVSTCSSGAGGAAGGAGSFARAGGTFGSNGYLPSDGTIGSIGQPGAHGAPGGWGDSAECVVYCSGDCTSRLCLPDLKRVVGPQGRCGCGGAGGGGGAAGRGGGASIALYVHGNAQVKVTRSLLKSGKGGNASMGGEGGNGGVGTPGSEGPTTPCNQGCARGVDCTCSPSDPAKLAGGAAGGKGGNGGRGGSGGGGAGGPSIAVASFPRVEQVVLDPASRAALEPGNAGSGAGGGVSGVSAPLFPAPATP